MLRSLKDLESYAVSASDGNIGSVVNFLLDDKRWVVRYLMVKTNGFFTGHEVLISPISFGQVDWSTRELHVNLTKDKVQNSPTFEVNMPRSRDDERAYNNYFGYGHYWDRSGLWGTSAYPGDLASDAYNDKPPHVLECRSDAHLRSAKELRGYHIQGSDDAIGHVDDFIVDDATWEVRYLVVDTNNWFFGKKVLLAPQWASRISWEEGKVYMDLSRQAISSCPQWNPEQAVNREYEVRLYDYYGRPLYWERDAPLVNPAQSRDKSSSIVQN